MNTGEILEFIAAKRGQRRLNIDRKLDVQSHLICADIDSDVIVAVGGDLSFSSRLFAVADAIHLRTQLFESQPELRLVFGSAENDDELEHALSGLDLPYLTIERDFTPWHPKAVQPTRLFARDPRPGAVRAQAVIDAAFTERRLALIAKLRSGKAKIGDLEPIERPLSLEGSSFDVELMLHSGDTPYVAVAAVGAGGIASSFRHALIEARVVRDAVMRSENAAEVLGPLGLDARKCRALLAFPKLTSARGRERLDALHTVADALAVEVHQIRGR